MKGQTDKEISEAGGMLNYNKGLDCHVAWKCLTFPSTETFPQICNLYCPGSLECSCSLFNISYPYLSSRVLLQLPYFPMVWSSWIINLLCGTQIGMHTWRTGKNWVLEMLTIIPILWRVKIHLFSLWNKLPVSVVLPSQTKHKPLHFYQWQLLIKITVLVSQAT